MRIMFDDSDGLSKVVEVDSVVQTKQRVLSLKRTQQIIIL